MITLSIPHRDPSRDRRVNWLYAHTGI